MPRRILIPPLFTAWLLLTSPLFGQDASPRCATCHPREAATYARTSMSRSFYRPTRANSIENFSNAVYYHKPSDIHYAMTWQGDSLYQRQYQIGFDGKETNVLEKHVDYVLGSGNHSRTYLSRNASGNLIELPLAWYAEKGGYWALNPGYDAPDHDGFRRRIGVDCMFCHNAYPDIAPGGATRGKDVVFPAVMPEGIDCERCHGSGETHIRLASGTKPDPRAVRAAILNPARLPPARQMEVCMQCHLETTSFSLPDSIVRYDRAPFSYSPDKPLADYKLFFDRTPGSDDDSFLIASSAYRLRKSECFLQSAGKLTCLTCHDPHGERNYTAVCRECHAQKIDRLVAAGQHTNASNCVECHMAKRRTDDAVHVVMTDHWIRRTQPPRDLVAEKPEIKPEYRGEVELYYPARIPQPEDELYLAAAQVLQQSNLAEGVPRLAAAIDRFRPALPEFDIALADAYRNIGQCGKALPLYEKTMELNKAALCSPDPISTLKRALEASPADAKTWAQIGVAYINAGRSAEGITAFEKATSLDPELAEAWNDLGGVLLDSDPATAESALRRALQTEPNYAEAHNNLAGLLSNTGHFDEARFHFEAALRYKPDYNFARFNYGVALTRVNRLDEAEAQFEKILQNKPDYADAHEALGLVLASKGLNSRAVAQYREALRIDPDHPRANLTLGAALAESGDIPNALPFLRKAAQAAEPAIREQALAMIRRYQPH